MRTLEQARADAQALADDGREPCVIDRHVGGVGPGGPIAPTGRLLIRLASAPVPKHGVWVEVERVTPTRGGRPR